MQIVTSPVTVHAYGVYQRNRSEGGGPMTRRDGTHVEFVEVLDDDSTTIDAGVRRFTLDPTINGSRPDVGAVMRLELKDWCEGKAKVGGRGAYIASHRRNVVLSFAPAKS